MLNNLEQLQAAGLDQNLQYEIYMAEIFPQWMSFLPGGLVYPISEREDELDAHVRRWAVVSEDLIHRAKTLDILLDGRPRGDSHLDFNVEKVLEMYSFSANVRSRRNRWKKLSALINVSSDDSLWRKEKFGKEEWERFRAAVLRYLGEQA